jgi:hypothetical protein
MPYIFRHLAMRRQGKYFALSLEIGLKFPFFSSFGENEKVQTSRY